MKAHATKRSPAPANVRRSPSSVHVPMDSNIRKQRANIHQIVQPKLTVGQPNDKYEQEADSVADRIVAKQPIPTISGISSQDFSSGSQPGAAVQQAAAENVDEHRKEDKEEKAVQAKLIQLKAKEDEEKPVQAKLLQLKANEEEEKPVQAELLQRKAKEDEEKPVQAKLLQRQAKEEEEKPVQAELLQRKAQEEEEKPVQAKLLQRKGMEEKEKPVQAKKSAEEDKQIQTIGATASAESASRALACGATGSPLRPEVRGVLESGLGADLSQVRVHEDSASHAAAASINAKAFTHKNEIWLGAGQSQADLRLMAHETAHVVQQGGGLQSTAAKITPAAPKVQRSWLGDAVDWVADKANAAINWGEEKIDEFITNLKAGASNKLADIDGYKAFTFIIGEDLITGIPSELPRSGRNFIEVALDIIPGGETLKKKIGDVKIGEAGRELDDGVEKLLVKISPKNIMDNLKEFFGDLGVGDIFKIDEKIHDLIAIVMEPIAGVIEFGSTVAGILFGFAKTVVLGEISTFLKDNAKSGGLDVYPLLTAILGRDPLSGMEVEGAGKSTSETKQSGNKSAGDPEGGEKQNRWLAILEGFLMLTDSGKDFLVQLNSDDASSGLVRAVQWIKEKACGIYSSMGDFFNTLVAVWQSFTSIEDISQVGRKIVEIGSLLTDVFRSFGSLVVDILAVVKEVAVTVLGFIKDALISKLVDFARTTRGYPLLTVILGRDPFSDAPVERSAENIIHGFMCLMDGGEQQFQEMKQTGAIARLTTRIENAIATLNFTWEYIKGLFVRAWESFSLTDLALPFAAFARLMGIFAEPLGRLISFIGEVIRLVIEVALKLMNFPVVLVSNIINRAMQAFDDIKRDPIGFLKNLLRAVKTGFQKFFDNILTHLLNGVTGWLFKELADAGIHPPTDFSFRAILGFVLEVLGISMERIFQKLAVKIGQDKVDRIRGMVGRLTGIWAFVSDVMTRGPVAIWEYIQDQLSNLWDVVLDAVRNWVVTKIIEKITVKLLSMLDPTGIMAVVNGFIAFYNAIQSFIAYLREMLEIVNSFVEGVAEIARGNVESAANFLEGSLARAVPVVIGFLANQVGLGGLGRRIGEMIERVREMVDKGLDWLIDKAVSAGSAILNMGRNVIGSVSDWWRSRKNFRANDGSSHELHFQGSGAGARLILSSDDPIAISAWVKNRRDDLRSKGELDAAKDAALNTIENQLIPEIRATTNPQTAATGAQPIRTVDQILTSLSDNIAIVGVDGLAAPIPPMLVTPGFSSSIATDTEAKFIYDQEGNHLKGTPSSAGGGDLSGAMTAISNLGLRSGEWVKFHLINADLGGQAVHSNMVPAPGTFNTQYERDFESKMKRFFREKEKPLWFNIRVSHWAGNPPFLRSLTVRGGKMKTNNNQWIPDRGIAPWYRPNIQEPKAPVPGTTISLNNHIQSGRASNDNTVASEYGLFRRTVEMLRVRGQRINSVSEIRGAINAAEEKSGWTADRKVNHTNQVDRSAASGVISDEIFKSPS